MSLPEDAAPVPEDSAQDRSKPAWMRFAPLALIIGLLGLAFATGVHRHVSLAALSENYAALQATIADAPVLWGAAFVALYALAVSISLPGALWFTIAAGVLFDWRLGTLYAWTGATIGATIIFLAAKTALGDTWRAKLGDRARAVLDGAQADAFFYMILTRIIPLPFFLVNVAWAFVGARTRDYVAATAIGIIPGTLAYATLGAAAREAIAAGEGLNVSLLAQPKLIAGLAGLGALTLVGLWLKKRRAGAELQA